MKTVELKNIDIEWIIKNALSEEVDKQIEKKVNKFKEELFKQKTRILIDLVANIQNNIYEMSDEVIVKIPLRNH